jgi:hypothetical protein
MALRTSGRGGAAARSMRSLAATAADACVARDDAGERNATAALMAFALAGLSEDGLDELFDGGAGGRLLSPGLGVVFGDGGLLYRLSG